VTVQVRSVSAGSFENCLPGLCRLLADSVDHGASVGFLAPLEPADAEAFWRRVEGAVASGRCLLLAAEMEDGSLAGTVLLDMDTLPNQPHRATVAKLLVHSALRRQGIGEALMAEVERAAAESGRWLLTLDTATDAAARLYVRRGWSDAGTIPDYALNPDGTLTATTFYWKRLRAD
jgi:ribosomal protein S18 acetylase RimI-like enzyme